MYNLLLVLLLFDINITSSTSSLLFILTLIVLNYVTPYGSEIFIILINYEFEIRKIGYLERFTFISFICICMNICVPHVCFGSMEARENIWLLEIRVTDSYELKCTHWKLNCRLLQEELMLLISKLSPQSLNFSLDLSFKYMNDDIMFLGIINL